MISEPELKKLARGYSCHPRTLRRIANKGIDITDASAIACHLAHQHTISVPFAEAVLNRLKTTTDQ